MTSLRNLVSGLLFGFAFTALIAPFFIDFASLFYTPLSHPNAWDTAPSSPDPAIGAIYPVNKHGSFIYWTAVKSGPTN